MVPSISPSCALPRQVFTALYNTDDSALVAAPTGSGKTACAEFALLRMITKAAADKGAPRCVYIAPLPALAKERLADWTAKARRAACSGCTPPSPEEIALQRDVF